MASGERTDTRAQRPAGGRDALTATTSTATLGALRGAVPVRKLVALAAIACTLAVAATAVAATRTVTVGDNYFVREGANPTVSVRRGDTVVWRWRGENNHSVTVRSGPARFDSGVK